MNTQTPNSITQSPNHPVTEDARLRAAVADAYAAPEISDALKTRLESLAADATATETKTAPRRFSFLKMRPTLAAGIALACVAVGAAIFVPRIPASAAARMIQALKDARSAHSVTYEIRPDGTRKKASELWYDTGKWRIEDDYSSRVCADGVCTTFYKKEKRAEIEKRDAPPGYEGWKGFSIASAREADSQNQMPLVKQGETTDGGRRLIIYRIGGELYPQSEQWVYVDAKTDLPVRAESYRKENGGKRLERLTFHDYNRTFAPAIFALNLPAGIVAEDKDQRITRLKMEWMPRFAKGVAEKQVNSTHVVIRDFRVNRDGDVFVLYTDHTDLSRIDAKASYNGEAQDMELTDEFGTKYLRPLQCFDLGPVHTSVNNWNATMNWENQKTGRVEAQGLIIDGVPVVAAHFVPMNDKRPDVWPRTFTLRRVAGDKMEFTLPVAGPSPEYVPGYAPLMLMSSNEDDLKQSRMTLRASYAHYREKDLPKALKMYEAMQAAIPSDYSIHTDLYYARAALLMEMNRPADALPLIKAAAATTLYNKYELDKINGLKTKIEAALR